MGKSPRYAEQSIYVTGFGSSSFEKAWDNLAFIHEMICSMGEGQVLPYENLLYKERWPMIVASNRFFTPQKKVMHEVLHAFPGDVDPLGHLAEAAAQNAMVHVKENEVKYYELLRREEGEYM